MRRNEELGAEFLRFALEVIEDLALQVDVQVRVGFVQQDCRGLVAEQEGEQGQGLMESLPPEMMS